MKDVFASRGGGRSTAGRISPGGRAGGRTPSSAGQAIVELIAVLPVLIAAGLAAFHVLAAHAAHEAAGNAAHAAAVAVLQDRDAESAARASLTGWPRRNITILRRGPHILVAVRPRLPVASFAARLTAEATADAGATPRPVDPAATRGGDGLSAAHIEEGR